MGTWRQCQGGHSQVRRMWDLSLDWNLSLVFWILTSCWVSSSCYFLFCDGEVCKILRWPLDLGKEWEEWAGVPLEERIAILECGVQEHLLRTSLSTLTSFQGQAEEALPFFSDLHHRKKAKLLVGSPGTQLVLPFTAQEICHCFWALLQPNFMCLVQEICVRSCLYFLSLLLFI